MLTLFVRFFFRLSETLALSEQHAMCILQVNVTVEALDTTTA